tara:strand:- start:670 stop:1257 length:588 start_codon:yes stop_codon:yes gene_type:complete
MFGRKVNATRTLAGVLVACGIAGTAHGDIVQDATGSAWASFLSNAWGQSFTAEGGEINLISADIIDVNEHLGAFDITVNLYEGIFGTLIDTQTTTLPDGHDAQWADFDFSGNVLTGGEIYSFEILSASGRGAIMSHNHTSLQGDPFGPDYEGGDQYVNGSVSELHDLTFRVTQVPAPGAMGVLAGGLALAARRRR